MFSTYVLRAQLLEIGVIERFDVRQRHTGETAVRIPLEGHALREGKIVAKHVPIALPFTEQLTTTLLQHQIRERLPGRYGPGEHRNSIRRSHCVDRI